MQTNFPVRSGTSQTIGNPQAAETTESAQSGTHSVETKPVIGLK